jgi:hypothetical protein
VSIFETIRLHYSQVHHYAHLNGDNVAGAVRLYHLKEKGVEAEYDDYWPNLGKLASSLATLNRNLRPKTACGFAAWIIKAQECEQYTLAWHGLECALRYHPTTDMLT